MGSRTISRTRAREPAQPAELIQEHSQKYERALRETRCSRHSGQYEVRGARPGQEDDMTPHSNHGRPPPVHLLSSSHRHSACCTPRLHPTAAAPPLAMSARRPADWPVTVPATPPEPFDGISHTQVSRTASTPPHEHALSRAHPRGSANLRPARSHGPPDMPPLSRPDFSAHGRAAASHGEH